MFTTDSNSQGKVRKGYHEVTRSRIGPLALESPLGDRGSTLFRAVHIQQKAQVAVRVFSQPMGMTPEAKEEFAQQMESLKALRHPNIVRCYGGGFDAKDAYLVYELADGDSLLGTLKRKERLPWELVLDLGLQLCEALTVAHQAGWIHGRIRPDKVIVSTDGTKVKLSDFRRGTVASAPLTAEQLAYCAPETISEKPTIDAASDLYSVGAVMYHAITGQAPFQAANALAMRKAIAETVAPPVATIVFDCPVWLSSIVEQLLSKESIKRPFSANATVMALREAQRRASEGISVAQHATSGFSPLQLNTNRAEAEKALGHKKTKKKKHQNDDGSDPTGLFERPWFLLTILVAAIGLISYLAWPLSESALRTKAETLMARHEAEGIKGAPNNYLQELADRFPEGKNGKWALSQLEDIEMEAEMELAEARIQKHKRFGLEPTSEGERKYAEARKFESFEDRITALELYKGIVNLLKDEENERAFVNLARKRIAEIEAKPPSGEELRMLLKRKLEQAEKLYRDGNTVGAKQIWEGIINLYRQNKEVQPIVEEAQKKIDELQDSP